MRAKWLSDLAGLARRGGSRGTLLVRTTLLNATSVATRAVAHYARTGRWEIREQNRLLAAWRRQLDAAASPRVLASGWDGGRNSSKPMSTEALTQVLEATVAGANGLIVSFSHDDYGRNYGGVQNVVRDEQKAFGQVGWIYLHLSPAGPLPMLSDPMPADEFRVSLRLDGALLGVATVASLISLLERLHSKSLAIHAIVHHLMGFAPELVLQMIQAAGDRRPVIWAHDFFSACPSYVLMRNDVAYCGAPPVDSPACGICCYGTERPAHVARIRNFFETADAIVVAPSESALEVWRRFELRHAETAVVPLAKLLLSGSEIDRNHDADERPLRIAHVGARAFRKGWAIFEELALRYADDKRYEFFQLGVTDGPALPRNIRNIPVRVDDAHRNAMVEAIAEARIDVVVSWSLWPETFCFTAQESLAAGAFVVANAQAGNVRPAIEAHAPDQGCAVADIDALFALFEGEGLRVQVRAAPRRRGILLAEGGSADWLLGRIASESSLPASRAVRSPSEPPLARSSESVSYG